MLIKEERGRRKVAEHYFSNKPSIESKPFSFTFESKGNVFNFTSDNGVFSKKEVDFGSRLLIDSFSAPEVDGKILDIGCGYGPIGLTLGKAYPDRQIVMTDVNERALELAKLNAVNNDVQNVDIYKSYLFDDIKERYFAAILSNPPIRAGKQVVHQIFEDAYHFLNNSGELWVVIQKKQGAPSAIEKLESMFSEVIVVEKKKGYFIIKSKKS